MDWLINYILSAGGFRVRTEEDLKPTDEELAVGLHVSVNDDYHFIPDITVDEINRAVNSLQWNDNFCAVMCTVHSGVSLEVSGWLGKEGLSAVYRNRSEDLREVTTKPPQSLDQVIELLVLFSKDDVDWQKKYFS